MSRLQTTSGPSRRYPRQRRAPIEPPHRMQKNLFGAVLIRRQSGCRLQVTWPLPRLGRSPETRMLDNVSEFPVDSVANEWRDQIRCPASPNQRRGLGGLNATRIPHGGIRQIASHYGLERPGSNGPSSELPAEMQPAGSGSPWLLDAIKIASASEAPGVSSVSATGPKPQPSPSSHIKTVIPVPEVADPPCSASQRGRGHRCG